MHIRGGIRIFAEEKYLNMAQDKYYEGVKEREVVGNSEGMVEEGEKALRDRIKRLERELRREKMRADLNEEIINVAEQMFKIQIREKN